MNYTRADIINALCAEWDYLCHDDFDPENDQTTEEYREELQNYSIEELVEETCTGEGYTLDEFMENWKQCASWLNCPPFSPWESISCILTVSKDFAMIAVETRKCSKCGAVHPLTEEFFGRNQSTNTGGDKYFRPECKKCTREAGKGKNEAYKLAGKPPVPNVGACCDRCGRDPGAKKNDPTKAKLVFDHCHETLQHRGWLCDNCNRAMGMLGDDIAGMILSAKYIAKTTGISKDQVLQQLDDMWDS